MVQALEEAAQRGVNIVILHEPNIDLTKYELLHLKKEGEVKLFTSSVIPFRGYTVVDAKHFLVETERSRSIFSGLTNSLFRGPDLNGHFWKSRVQAKAE